MRKPVEEIIDIIKRMKGFTKDHEVADLLGLGRGALSNAKKRNSLSFFNELLLFCDRENLSLDLIRHSPLSSSGSIRTVIAPGNLTPEENSELVRVGVYSIENVNSPDISDPNPVNTILIPRNIHKEDSIVIQVAGDSMEKLLMKGTNAVIDTSTKDIVSGNVYAFRIPQEGNIVRECHSDPSGLILRPYNKNYPTAQIKWEDFNPEMVIGKVSCSVVNVFR